MTKKFLLILFLIFSFSQICISAGTDDGSSKVSTNYDKAKKLIIRAKKLDEKGKTEKALKRYEKALKYLLKSNQKKPLQADTLNYLGFTSRKLGDFEKGEEYYLLGLQIDPQHKGINEYLGELYVVTNRIDLAKERLEVLVNCNCKEYSELKEIIDGTKKSKY